MKRKKNERSEQKSLLFTNIAKENKSPKLIANAIEISIGNKISGGTNWIHYVLQKNAMTLGPIKNRHNQQENKNNHSPGID